MSTLSNSRSPTLEPVTFPLIAQFLARYYQGKSSSSSPSYIEPTSVRKLHASLIYRHVSLFERLIESSVRSAIPSVLLNVQRRMHPTILAFPNSAFYCGALIDHPVTMAGGSLPSLEELPGSRLLSDSRVALIYTSSPNDSRSGGPLVVTTPMNTLLKQVHGMSGEFGFPWLPSPASCRSSTTIPCRSV